MKLIKVLLSGCYFIALLYVVFFARRRRVYDIQYLNIIPLKNTVRMYSELEYLGAKEANAFYMNLLGNILMFIPFSIILIEVMGVLSYRRVMLYALLASLFIETVQYVFKIGVSDIDDILLNVTGALIGIVVLQLHYRMSRSRLVR